MSNIRTVFYVGLLVVAALGFRAAGILAQSCTQPKTTTKSGTQNPHWPSGKTVMVAISPGFSSAEATEIVNCLNEWTALDTGTNNNTNTSNGSNVTFQQDPNPSDPNADITISTSTGQYKDSGLPQTFDL